MSRYVLHTASKGDRVAEVAGRVTSSLPKDTTNYWSFTFSRLRRGQVFGERFGTFGGDTYDLSATKDNKLVNLSASLPLDEGDMVVVDIDQTGTPDPLEGLSIALLLTSKGD